MEERKFKDIIESIRQGHYGNDEAMSRIRSLFEDEPFSPHRMEQLVVEIVEHVHRRLLGWTIPIKVAEQLREKINEEIHQVTMPEYGIPDSVKSLLWKMDSERKINDLRNIIPDINDSILEAFRRGRNEAR